MPASEQYKRFSRLPEGRPHWLGPWQLYPCGRCGAEVDSGAHQCITDEDRAGLENNEQKTA